LLEGARLFVLLHTVCKDTRRAKSKC
jgi:hypothetical protein